MSSRSAVKTISGTIFDFILPDLALIAVFSGDFIEIIMRPHDLLSGIVYSRSFQENDEEYFKLPGTFFTCSLIEPNLWLTKISLVFNTIRILHTLVMFIVSASMDLLWLDRFLETCFIRLDSPELKRLIVLENSESAEEEKDILTKREIISAPGSGLMWLLV